MLLEIDNLSTIFATRKGTVQAVDNVSLKLDQEEMLGLIGESGCGKSTMALSILRLIESPGQITAGSIKFQGKDLLKLTMDEMRRVRWRQISMIPQSAMNALNPVIPIGKQIIEVLQYHRPDLSYDSALQRTRELLDLVGIDSSRWRSYPHEFSGGMKQRVAIAMALSCDPEIVIADESTTGLDVLTEAQVVALIKGLQQEKKLSVLVISHDLHLVSAICNRLAVMYAGQLVETAPTGKLLAHPLHPYTRGLLAANIPLESDRPCTSIPGSVPDLANPPSGCRFRTRCPKARAECSRRPPVLEVEVDHRVACFLYGEGKA